MPLDAAELKTLQELLDDAKPCPRLSDWEETFLGDMRGRVARAGVALRLSEAQLAALKRIEAKVYAT